MSIGSQTDKLPTVLVDTSDILAWLTAEHKYVKYDRLDGTLNAAVYSHYKSDLVGGTAMPRHTAALHTE